MATVEFRALLTGVIATGIIVGCAAGGTAPSVTPANPTITVGNAALATSAAPQKAQSRRARIAFSAIGQPLYLPPTAAMTERVTLPANDAPPGATLEVTVSNAVPSFVPRLPARENKAFMSFTLRASADVTLHGIPKFAVKLPSVPANHGAFYAWAFSRQRGWRDFGPMTVSGKELTFGGSRKDFGLVQGIVYAVIPFTADVTAGCPTPPPTVLFVSNENVSTVTQYAPPYTGAPATISNGVSYPYAVGFNASGQLFIANGLEPNSNVAEYAPPYSGAPIAVISNGIRGPTGISFDASGDLFVTNNGYEDVTEYAPPYTGAPIATISNGLNSPYGTAFDTSGNLYVTNGANNNVTVYAAPYTGAPIATISNGVDGPTGVAFSASGNLFVANYAGNTVTEYAPPYTGAPIATITNSLNVPYGIAFDPSGNLFVSNHSGNTVTEYAPPYTGAPIATISNGISTPLGLAFGP